MDRASSAHLATYEKFFILLLYGLFLLALLHQLGTHPLFQEEPRRGLIALEMLFADELIVPTEFGINYYNKPPLWNWVVMAGFRLFGQNEWGVRIFSALSFFFTGILLAAFGRKHLNERVGLYAGLFYLASADLLFGFSVLGEIDLFYSFITVASLLGFYHYSQQDKWWVALLLLYGLNGLGVLTKGLPSFVFAGLTVLAWLAYTRQWRKLWHPAHFAGIFLFLAIVGGYFYAYSLRAPLEPFLQTLLSQSSERTLADESSTGLMSQLLRLGKHLISFPLHSLLLNALPGSLLLFWVLSKAGRKYMKQEPVLAFCLLMLAVHFLPYWISPGAKARYVYMLFPLMILPGVAAWFYTNPAGKWRNYVYDGVYYLALYLLPIGAIAIHFIADLQVLGSLRLLSVSVFLALSWVLILLMYFRLRALRPLLLFLAFVVLRLGYNSIVAPLRASTSDASKDKALGIELAARTEGSPVCFYKESRPSRTMVFYYERDKQEVLAQKDSLEANIWYVLDQDYADVVLSEELTRFQFRGREFRVGKVE